MESCYRGRLVLHHPGSPGLPEEPPGQEKGSRASGQTQPGRGEINHGPQPASSPVMSVFLFGSVRQQRSTFISEVNDDNNPLFSISGFYTDRLVILARNQEEEQWEEEEQGSQGEREEHHG